MPCNIIPCTNGTECATSTVKQYNPDNGVYECRPITPVIPPPSKFTTCCDPGFPDYSHLDIFSLQNKQVCGINGLHGQHVTVPVECVERDLDREHVLVRSMDVLVCKLKIVLHIYVRVKWRTHATRIVCIHAMYYWNSLLCSCNCRYWLRWKQDLFSQPIGTLVILYLSVIYIQAIPATVTTTTMKTTTTTKTTTKPATGTWSEWAAASGAQCSDTCGSCGKINAVRTCLPAGAICV